MILKSKTAVVTGSTSGIGLAYARAMAAEGANVLINGFGKPEDIEAEREKDIRYSSRTRLNTDAQLRIHRLKTSLAGLLKTLPQEMVEDPEIKLLSDFAKEPSVIVVQLIYRDRAYEGSFKDVEFSRQTMVDHWASGLVDGERSVLRRTHNPPEPGPGGAVSVDPGLDANPDRTNPRDEDA